MTRALVEGVHVAGRSFAAGDVPPEEYAVLITNPRAWGDPVETDRKSRRLASQIAAAKAAIDDLPKQMGEAVAEASESDSDGGDAEAEETGSYDPSAAGQGLDEVNNYLANADEDEVRRVLALEAAGKARKGILQGPYSLDDPADAED